MFDKARSITDLRRKLSLNQPSVGSWLQIPSSATAEIMASSGYDWLAVDLEHGSISTSQLPDIFRSIELNDCLPFARVASHSFFHLQAALDAGAAGLIIPNVRTLDDINFLSSYVNWPPQGTRGVGFSRANLYGQNFDYYKSFNQSIFLVGMIEDYNVIPHLSSMLSMRKLDAILIGPYDLSATLSVTGCFESEIFLSAIDTVFSICRQFSVPCGFHIVDIDPTALLQKISNGYLFNAYSIDSLFLAKSSSRPLIN
jgi:2-dehydro-3-deoxyglucarate aldolase